MDRESFFDSGAPEAPVAERLYSSVEPDGGQTLSVPEREGADARGGVRERVRPGRASLDDFRHLPALHSPGDDCDRGDPRHAPDPVSRHGARVLHPVPAGPDGVPSAGDFYAVGAGVRVGVPIGRYKSAGPACLFRDWCEI